LPSVYPENLLLVINKKRKNRLKILYRYTILSFLKPFLSTFLIAMFILILQLVWLIFDDMAGKGITFGILMKYIFYVSVIAVPKAVPIAILLSSIMALGQLSENYEFAAIKSAGVSLQRLMLPLFSIVLIFSFINLFFLNNAYPWAMMKQKNLYTNIKKKQPALALVEGTFNTDVPGFVLKFDKKYGKEKNLLKNVLIYQTKSNGNVSTITAQKGTIKTEEGSKYMSLFLENGYYYEEHSHRGSKLDVRNKAPFSATHFDTYTVNIDISAFSAGDLESERYKSDREMLSLEQLGIYSDSLKVSWDDYLKNRAVGFSNRLALEKLVPNKDTIGKKIEYPILSNFELQQQTEVLSIAENNIINSISDFQNFTGDFKYRRKGLNLIDTEYHHRIAIAFSALLLFIIGAPLGSLIRKGGFGLPMVMAIIIYMVYHFLSSFAGNMAEESTINHFWGGWLSTLIFIPIGIYLVISATLDRGKLNLNFWIDRMISFFNRFSKNKEDQTPKQDSEILD
jgi:lipopolysaccharide export system permease protein